MSIEKKWNDFMDSLEKKAEETGDGEYREIRGYFEAIKAVSELDADKIDEESERERIDEQIGVIADFTEKHKEYYELGRIKGFRRNQDKQIKGQDYDYYIADQQVKAAVCFARYLNFIERSEEVQEADRSNMADALKKIARIFGLEIAAKDYDDKKLCEKIIAKVDEKIESDFFDISESELKKEINELDERIRERFFKDTVQSLYKTPENANEEVGADEAKLRPFIKLRGDLLLYMDAISGLNYKIYMMLNNMMREIRFSGAAYQYLWHWNKSKKTLYRSGVLDGVVYGGYEYARLNQNDVRERFKTMFEDSIGHMKSESRIRHSFSENLLLVIYKYLIVEVEGSNYLAICESGKKRSYRLRRSGIEVRYQTDMVAYRTKKTDLYIIKDADINSVFVSEQNRNRAYSFYNYIGEHKEQPICGYSVEMYPQSLEGERNKKGTVKYMKDTLFPLYFRSWGIDAMLATAWIADDKEVVTWGKHYTERTEIGRQAFEEAKAGTLFHLSLEKDDICCLLLKIYEKKVGTYDASEKIVNEAWGYIEGYKGPKYERFRKISWKYDGSTLFITTRSQNVPLGSDEMKNIESDIKDFLKKRYKRLLENDNPKVAFIMARIEENGFDFRLVKQYNRYLHGRTEDPEIAILKQIIFKG